VKAPVYSTLVYYRKQLTTDHWHSPFQLYCTAFLLNNCIMSKHCRTITAILLLWGLFCGLAQASKSIIRPDSSYVVDVWGAEDGLPGGEVLSVIQAHDGYLWVGTLYGLARFDGLRFTPFSEADTPGLVSGRIVDLFQDSRSNLWAGTESAGILLIKPSGQMTNFPVGIGMPGGQLSSACEDANASVWLKLLNGGLVRYSSNKLEAIAGQFPFVIAEKAGMVWLAQAANLFGIVASPGSGAMIVQQTVPVEDLKFLLASKTGGYWRLAGGRIEKWQGGQLVRDLGPYPWNPNDPKSHVMAACEDNQGNLIVGTYGDGVYWFNSKGGCTHLLNELSHSSVLSLAFDREGNLWVATNGGGLDRVKRKLFAVLPQTESTVVQSVSPDQHGGLWIGYNWNRIDHWSNGVSEKYPFIQNSYVKAVFVDKAGQVFAGISGISGSGGDELFQLNAGKFATIDVPLADVSAIHQDRTGRLWIGAQNGLLLLDQTNSTLYSTKDGLPAADVRAIADDAEGNVWIGTGGGLACLRDGRITSFRKQDDGLPSEDVSSLLVDSEGVLWIGTRGSGLVRYANKQWTHYTTSQGLAGDNIGYLIEDNETNLWLGSNAGLMRVAKESLNDFAIGVETNAIACRVYIEEDGLPTRECTQGSQPAACATPNGTLWFPTTAGLAFLNPSTLKPNLLEPPVIIESVSVEGQRQNTNRFVATPSELIIPPGKGNLDIHYASLNLGAADRSRFKYRLYEQQETPWKYSESGTRDRSYGRLLPGTYHFEVSACNEDGIWNSHPAMLTIIVQPHLWQRGWFQAAVILGILAIIAGIVYYFSTQKLHRELAVMRQQEALEQERARIARDLHDQLGANLTQVALLGEMAETDKNLPEEVEEHAQQIYQTARETTRALDEIVWAVNPSNDTLEGLANYSGKYAQEYFALAGLRYRVDMPNQLPEVNLPPEVRHNVFLAFKESVNNVVKHAQATEARVRLRLDNGSFTFEIEDNGKGFAGAEKKSGRNGLRNMRKRMEDVGGNFSIGPAAGQGTLVRLTAPVANHRTNAN
jgi:signal transduction histidine kinase/ligand-binding sensor domain-containing protein